MNPDQLDQKEDKITTEYQDFLEQVREAFDRHCDEIRVHAEKKLEGIPETDEEGRKRVQQEEQAELDKTLAELKELLAKRELQVRQQLEEIETTRENEEFNIEDELAQVTEAKGNHSA